jgi:hypothetical protein
MKLDLLVRHQALGEWRDRTIVEAARLLNQAAVSSLAAFEDEVPQAGMITSVWDPASFATVHIDRAMLRRVRADLPALLTRAAQELAAISPAQDQLAEGIQEAAGGLVWPELQEVPVTAEAVPTERAASAEPESFTSAIGRYAQLVLSAGQMAASTAAQLSETANRSFKDRSGLDDRLRSAARTRIVERWTGHAGEPRPILAQIMTIIDEATNLARSAA